MIFVARLRRQCPAMFVRGVVEDEVEHQADAVLAQIRRQGAQVVHGAQFWVDLAVVADGIAAVIVAVGRLEERHEMEIGQTQLLEIGDFGAHSLQVAGEKIDIVDATQHLLGLEPARILLADAVEFLQGCGTIEP